MEKRIYDKQTGIQYELQGDYYLPCLALPEQPKVEIGIWGKRHLRYIKQQHKIRYTNLLTSCKLTAYLADINEQAEDIINLSNHDYLHVVCIGSVLVLYTVVFVMCFVKFRRYKTRIN